MNPRFSVELISTGLLMRRLHPNDAAAICAYRSLPQVARYQHWTTFSLEDAAHLTKEQNMAEPNIPGTWFQFAIIKLATGNLIGDCGLHCWKEDPRQMEVGITLSPSHQGFRYADEAIECLL